MSGARTASGSLADAPRLLARGLARSLVWSVMALMALLAAWAIVAAAIPRAAIFPATDLTDVRTDRAITSHGPIYARSGWSNHKYS